MKKKNMDNGYTSKSGSDAVQDLKKRQKTECKIDTESESNTCSDTVSSSNLQRRNHGNEKTCTNDLWSCVRFSALNLHSIGPYLFFFEVAAVGLYGIFVFLPYVFEEDAYYHQIAGSVMILEIILNWYFIAFTDCSFLSTTFPKHSLRIDFVPITEVPEIARNSKDKAVITDQHIEQGVFPYWSWSPCYKCKIWRPPRCHHCALCGKCVLKRDHHFISARTCIGFFNQKYYIVLCAWTLLSQIYSLCLVLGFYFGKIWDHVTIFDALPLFSFLRYFTGYDHGWTGILVIFAWLLSIFACVGLLQFVSALHQLFNGEIAFEIENRIHLNDERSISAKLRSVFGDFWFLNFIFPLFGGRYSPNDDPYHWIQLKPPKRQVHMRVL